MINDRRIVIIEPGLRDLVGHYFNLTWLLAEECRRRGLECMVFSNTRISAEVIAALPVSVDPFFSMGTYFGSSSDPLAGDVESFMEVHTVFSWELSRLSHRLGARDIVLVPTASERIMASFASWLARMEPNNRPRLVLSFSFDPAGVDDPLRTHALRMLYRTGFNAVRRSPARRWISLVTNSVPEDYRVLADTWIDPVPIAQPARFLAERCAGPVRSDGRVTVVVLGSAVERKGFHLLPEIVRRVLAGGRPIGFAIQAYGYGPEGGPPTGLRPAAAELDQLEIAHPEMIRLIRTPLSLIDYHTLLGASDIVLAAYSPSYDQISGVFHEAVAFGKVVVSRQGTAIEASALDLGAAIVPFAEYTAASIADAILKAEGNIGPLLEQARAVAEVWHRTTGTGPYLDRILEVCARDEADLARHGPETGPDGTALLPFAQDMVFNPPQWPYRMINPDQWERVRATLRRLPDPAGVCWVLDLVLVHLERGSGAVILTRREIAARAGLDPRQACVALHHLARLRILLPRRSMVFGRGGRLRYFINPHLAWYGNLDLRSEQARRTVEPLTQDMALDPPQWPYFMINPDLWDRVLTTLRRLSAPAEACWVLDLVLQQLERDSGAVNLTRHEIAARVGLEPRQAAIALHDLARLGILLPRRSMALGKGGRLRYFINPHLAWRGDLDLRAGLARGTAVPLAQDMAPSPSQWPYCMVNQDLWERVRSVLRQLADPAGACWVMDLVLAHLEPGSGAVILTSDEITARVGLDPHQAAVALDELVRLRILLPRRSMAIGKGGEVRYFINPHLAWYGNLDLRSEQARRAVLPFSDAG